MCIHFVENVQLTRRIIKANVKSPVIVSVIMPSRILTISNVPTAQFYRIAYWGIKCLSILLLWRLWLYNQAVAITSLGNLYNCCLLRNSMLSSEF